MDMFKELWQPILLAGVACFILSALAWTVLPHHKSERKRLPTEQDMLEALRRDMPRPGLYAFPFAKYEEMNRPDVKVAFDKGPVGHLTIMRSGRPGMSMMLGQMMLFFVITSALIACVNWHAGFRIGASAPNVFRTTATVATMVYAFGTVPESVWFGRPWKSWLLQLVDSLLYALATAGIFVWLWPQ